MSYPNNFRSCVSQDTMLRFTTRTRNSRLFLSTPQDEIVTQKHCVTRGGATRVRATSPISVRVGSKTSRWRGREIKAIMKSILNIPKDTFKGLKVMHRGRLHISTDKLTAWVRSGWVIVKYCKAPTMEWYSVGSVKASPSLDNCFKTTMRVVVGLQSSNWAQARILWAYFTWLKKRPLAKEETSRPRK